jgi:hypothetical protein
MSLDTSRAAVSGCWNLFLYISRIFCSLLNHAKLRLYCQEKPIWHTSAAQREQPEKFWFKFEVEIKAPLGSNGHGMKGELFTVAVSIFVHILGLFMLYPL